MCNFSNYSLTEPGAPVFSLKGQPEIRRWRELPPNFQRPSGPPQYVRSRAEDRYFFFFAAAALAARACCFCLSALLWSACFWEDFFWLDFGDLSPMALFFSAGWLACGMLVSPEAGARSLQGAAM